MNEDFVEDCSGDINHNDRFGVAPFDTEDFGRSGGLHCTNADQFFQQSTNRTNYQVYNTEAHKGIYSRLISQSNTLVKDGYVNRMGENCITLVGAKGIGKTTSLKTFVTLSKYVVPGFYAIYVSLNNILIDKDLSSKTLLTVVVKILRGLGVEIRDMTADEVHTGLHLVNVLLEKKIKLLLLIDELDQLYKIKEKVALENLHELSFLGNQSTGTVSVIVCGSSAMMEFLITTNASQSIRDEFPLLTMGAPNLNGTKFQTRRVSSNLPIDLITTGILAEKHTTSQTINWVRLVAFVAGAGARSVGRVISDAGQDGEILNSISPDANYTGANTLSKEHLARLRTKILKKLYSKNANMFDSIKNASNVAAAIATTPWEKGGEMEFQPLTYKEVQKIWKGLIRKKIVSEDDRMFLDTSLLHLADRGWIVIGSVKDSHPTDLFPFSLLQVFQDSIREDVMPSLRERIAEHLKQGPVELAKLAANPRTVTAAASVFIACGACIVM